MNFELVPRPDQMQRFGPKTLRVPYTIPQIPSCPKRFVRCPLPYSLLLASCDPFALKRIDITTDVNHEGSARRTRPGYWRPGRGRRPNRRRRGVRASTTWPTATVTSATEEGRWWRAGFPINTNQGQDVNWKICTGFPTVLLFIFSG